jgi:hypothetical protein
LKTLKLYIDQQTLDDAMKINIRHVLNSCSQTLESLSLDFSNQKHFVEASISDLLSPLDNINIIKKFKINASLDSRNLEQLSKIFPNLEYLEFDTVIQPHKDFTQFLMNTNRLKTLKIKNTGVGSKLQFNDLHNLIDNVTLRHLELRGVKLSYQDLLAMFTFNKKAGFFLKCEDVTLNLQEYTSIRFQFRKMQLECKV